jgi:hypothetical protein
MLPGMVTMGGVVALPESSGATLVNTYSDDSVDNDTWTVSVSLGAVPQGGATRHIVVATTNYDDDALDSSVTWSATIAGITMTQIITTAAVNSSTDNSSHGAIFIAEVPTGTSGSFVATVTGYSGTLDRWKAAVFRLIGLDSATPTYAEDVPGSVAGDITLSVPTSGFGVVLGISGSALNIGSFTGSGATTAYSGTPVGAVMYRTTAGSVTHDASNAFSFAGAAWEFG